MVVAGIGLALAGLGLSGVAHLRSALEHWVTDPGDDAVRVARLRTVLGAAATATTLPLAGIALHLWRLGAQVVQGGRFPPAGASILRPTPIVTGRAAHRRGRALQTLGVVLVLAAVGLAVMWWRLSWLLTPERP